MIDSENAREARRQFPIALAAAAVIVALAIGAISLLSRHSQSAAPSAGVKPMAFGPAEQAYAPHVHLTDIQLSKSSNLLNQQFTYINGTVSNDGDRAIAGMALTVEFYSDVDNKKLALRDTEPVITSNDPPLPAGQNRPFTMTMDRYPDGWNQQMPKLAVSGLVLQ